MGEPKIKFKLEDREGVASRIYEKDGEAIVLIKHGEGPESPGKYFCTLAWLREGKWLTQHLGPYDVPSMAKDVADAVAIGIEALTGGTESIVPEPSPGAELTDTRAADSPTRSVLP